MLYLTFLLIFTLLQHPFLFFASNVRGSFRTDHPVFSPKPLHSAWIPSFHFALVFGSEGVLKNVSDFNTFLHSFAK